MLLEQCVSRADTQAWFTELDMNDDDDEALRRAAERARLEDRLARARRRLDQCTLILAEQRQKVGEAEERGMRVGEAKALLKVFEDSHGQFTQDCERAEALLAALGDGAAGG